MNTGVHSDTLPTIRMTRLDELTDINFRLICQNKSGVSWLHFVDIDGEQLIGQIREQIAEYMTENGLVTMRGEVCHLDLKSEHICKIGWIEYLKSEYDLPKKTDLSFDTATIENLERLKNGQTFTLTKDSHKESAELIQNLNNLGILNKPTRFGYACDLKNRKYLTKLIELKSWEKFLDWSENNNTESNITNNFSGSTIGQLNQSESLKVERTDIKQRTSPQTPKPNKKSSISPKLIEYWWLLVIAIIAGIILLMIERGIIDIGI